MVCSAGVLVAGGVGATFIMPIYKSVQEQFVTEGKSPDRATFAWSMRSTAEASWAIDPEAGDTLSEDENLKLYLTSGFLAEENHGDEELLPVDGSVELTDLASDEEVKGVKEAGSGRDEEDEAYATELVASEPWERGS